MNDAPSGTDTTVSTLEETTYTFAAADFGFNDLLDNHTFDAVRITSLPLLGTLTYNSAAVIAGDYISVDDVNLGLLEYTPPLDGVGLGYTSFGFQVQDTGGTSHGGVNLSTGNTLTVDVVNVNDAPTLAGGPYDLGTTDENTTTVGTPVATILAGLTTGDADGDTLGLAVTTTAGNGAWQYSTDSTDGSDGAWTDFGGVAADSALLLTSTSWLRFQPDTIIGTPASLTVHAWDGTAGTASTAGSPSTANPAGGGGTTAFSSGTATANLTVTDINDAPTLTSTGSDPTFTEGGAAAGLFSGTGVSTIESGQTLTGLTLTVSNISDGADEKLNLDGSSLALTDGNSGTTTTHSLSYSVSVTGSTATVTLTGTLTTAETEALVDTLSYQNDSANPTAANRVVTLTQLVDAGGIANGGDDTASLSLASTVTVQPENDAPTLAGGPYDLGTTDENTTTVGTPVATILAGLTTGDADGDTLGLAVTTTAGNGAWQYSTDSTDGSDGAWTDFGGVAADSALVLTNTSWLRFQPDTIIGTPAGLTFHAWDGTAGTASTAGSPSTANPAGGGGTTAFSSGTATANLTVTDINDAPTLTSTGSDPTFTEGGAAAGLFSGTGVSTIRERPDPDRPDPDRHQRQRRCRRKTQPGRQQPGTDRRQFGHDGDPQLRLQRQRGRHYRHRDPDRHPDHGRDRGAGRHPELPERQCRPDGGQPRGDPDPAGGCGRRRQRRRRHGQPEPGLHRDRAGGQRSTCSKW